MGHSPPEVGVATKTRPSNDAKDAVGVPKMYRPASSGTLLPRYMLPPTTVNPSPGNAGFLMFANWITGSRSRSPVVGSTSGQLSSGWNAARALKHDVPSFTFQP